LPASVLAIATANTANNIPINPEENKNFVTFIILNS
jgi:hypothetical protein